MSGKLTIRKTKEIIDPAVSTLRETPMAGRTGSRLTNLDRVIESVVRGEGGPKETQPIPVILAWKKVKGGSANNIALTQTKPVTATATTSTTLPPTLGMSSNQETLTNTEPTELDLPDAAAEQKSRSTGGVLEWSPMPKPKRTRRTRNWKKMRKWIVKLDAIVEESLLDQSKGSECGSVFGRKSTRPESHHWTAPFLMLDILAEINFCRANCGTKKDLGGGTHAVVHHEACSFGKITSTKRRRSLLKY